MAGVSFLALACNALGCLLIGALLVYAEQIEMPDAARALLVTGVLGALTTFSTFGWETLVLWEDRKDLALLNVGANVVVALVAVALGMAGARLLE